MPQIGEKMREEHLESRPPTPHTGKRNVGTPLIRQVDRRSLQSGGKKLDSHGATAKSLKILMIYSELVGQRLEKKKAKRPRVRLGLYKVNVQKFTDALVREKNRIKILAHGLSLHNDILSKRQIVISYLTYAFIRSLYEKKKYSSSNRKEKTVSIIFFIKQAIC